VWVQGIGPNQLYAYPVDGSYEPSKGHRFNFNRLLLQTLIGAILWYVFGPRGAVSAGATRPQIDARSLWVNDNWLVDDLDEPNLATDRRLKASPVSGTKTR